MDCEGLMFVEADGRIRDNQHCPGCTESELEIVKLKNEIKTLEETLGTRF